MDPDYEVKRIIEEKDLYKILNVDKKSSESEIKEKYHKLAKIVHPDRCHNEKATEAFQKISNAYKILSDSEKRSMYDQYGDTQPRTQNYAYREEEVTPYDLFSFIFGGYPNRRFRTHQNNQRRRNNQNQQSEKFRFNFMSPLVILSVLLFLLNTFDFSSIYLLFSNPASRKNLKGIIRFNDQQSSDYFCMQSKKYRVNYCLPNWWINSQKNELRSRILKDTTSVADGLYEEKLRINCELEKNQFGGERNQCALKKKILNE